MNRKKIQREKVVPIIDVSVRELCQQPYSNHPKGCPNYGRRLTCPPQAKLWSEICDLGTATWVFWTRFDLGTHRERMKARHPSWSRRQLDCCLYWQGTARKPLREFIQVSLSQVSGLFLTMCPEAMGINVTQTMRKIGIELEWPPEKWTYQVAMGGWLL
ncbi:hypothetical protein LCGC14_0421150 [marine sediment metagenome]|uniref:DUF2284 domain-containing protein n=1 Tax=marine sediment metagenome TaxID=412755 RepID=A0A0F9W026_9ZZZZ